MSRLYTETDVPCPSCHESTLDFVEQDRLKGGQGWNYDFELPTEYYECPVCKLQLDHNLEPIAW